MSTLRKKVIRLAHTKPELRPHLLPLLQKTGRAPTSAAAKIDDGMTAAFSDGADWLYAGTYSSKVDEALGKALANLKQLGRSQTEAEALRLIPQISINIATLCAGVGERFTKE